MGLRPTPTLDLIVRLQDRASGDLRRFESSVIRTMGSIASAIALVTSVAFPITEAAKFQREMATVGRTTGYGADQIQRLGEALVPMSTRLGIGADKLAQIAAVAGQLGLADFGRKAVESFTESVARASVTLDMTTEKAADSGAQISAIYGLDVGEVERVFAMVNSVAKKSVATGEAVFDIMKRVGTTAGATVQQVAGLAGAMSQFGIPNEQGGTALVKFLGNQLAESEKFAKLLGMSQEKWVGEVRRNSVESLKMAFREISKMDDAVGAAVAKKLFGSGRLSSIATKWLMDAKDEFMVIDSMIEEAYAAYAEGTSSIDDYAKIMKTVTEQANVFATSFKGLALEAGEASLGPVEDMLRRMSAAMRDPAVVSAFTDIGTWVVNVAVSLGDMVFALGQADISWRNVGAAVRLVLSFLVIRTFALWSLAIASLAVTMTFTLGRALLVTTSAIINWRTVLLGALSRVLLAWQAARAAFGMTAILASGGIAAAAGVLIFTFWDEITTFLGFVDKAQEKARADAVRNRQDFERAKAEAISDYEEYVAQVNKIVNKAGDVPRQDIGMGDLVLMDASESSEILTRLVKDYTLLVATVRSAGPAIASASNDLSQLVERQMTLEKRLSAVRRQLDANRARLDGGTDNPALRSDITQGVEYEKRLQTELSITADEVKKVTDALKLYRDGQRKAAEGLTSLIAKSDVMRQIDQTTAAVIIAVANVSSLTAKIKEARDKQEELRRSADAIIAQDVAEAGGGGSTEEQQAAANTAVLESIQKARDEHTRYTVELARAQAVVDGLTSKTSGLSDAQRRMIGTVSSLSVEMQKELAIALQARKSLPIGDQQVAWLRENANAIVFNHAALKKLKSSYDVLGNAAKDYAKTAAAAFDNTSNEIVALGRKLAEFSAAFKLEGEKIRADLGLDNAVSGIDKALKKDKEAIDKLYDARIDAADGAAKEMLKVEKQAELDRLETARNAAVADKTATALRVEYNKALADTKRLIMEANAAAKAGDIDRALALKEQAKDRKDAAQDALSEMQKLRVTSVGEPARQKEEAYFFSESALRAASEREGMMLRRLYKDREQNVAAMQSEGMAALKGSDGFTGNTELLEQARRRDAEAAGVQYDAGQRLSAQYSGLIKLQADLTDAEKAGAAGAAQAMADRYRVQVAAQAKLAEAQGPDSLVFGQGELDKMLGDLNATGEVLGAGIKDTNEAMNETAMKVAAKWQEVSDNLGDTFKRSEQSIAALNGAFTNVGPLMDAAANSIALSSGKLGEMLSNLGAATSNPYAAATTMQPASFDDTIVNEALKASLHTFANEVGTRFSETLIRATDVARYTERAKPDAVPPLDVNLRADWKTLQAQLDALMNAETLTIQKAKIEQYIGPDGVAIAPGAIKLPGYARGGPVVGPGTGTSDSILAWLSNGERVVDAHTTGFFGSAFWNGLSYVAHSGRGTPSTKAGLPALAGGGTAEAVPHVGSVTITIGGEAYSLWGERKSAAKLIRALEAMGK